jgi:hypothetical protein
VSLPQQTPPPKKSNYIPNKHTNSHLNRVFRIKASFHFYAYKMPTVLNCKCTVSWLVKINKKTILVVLLVIAMFASGLKGQVPVHGDCPSFENCTDNYMKVDANSVSFGNFLMIKDNKKY